MKLTELAHLLPGAEVNGNADVEVKGLAYDSRLVEAGDVFFCIKGFKTDGHKFVPEALARGAVAVIADRTGVSVVEDLTGGNGLNCPVLKVDDSRRALAVASSALYGHPSRKLRLVGITGTNGKTTTAYLVESIMRTAGLRTGLVGTVEYRVAGRVLPVDRTTPESLDLQRLLSQMVEKRVEAAVMEVSSHAIDLGRIGCCSFSSLVFTNLSSEHLDYHKTMDDYFRVKKQLFEENHWVVRVVNKDDEYGAMLVDGQKGESLTYGIRTAADVAALDLETRPDGSRFTLKTPVGQVPVKLSLPGLFNVYNALAAAGASLTLGLKLDQIATGLAAVQTVPGRFQRVDCGQDFTVVVDYAHTPDGLEKALTAARGLTEGQLIAVFGCGGDRDRIKRPLMGKVASELSDYCVITSDNPRSEEPAQIMREIEAGVTGRPGVHYELQEDRRSAIRTAIERAKSSDFVVIAGKGHEREQEFADRKIPFDDVEVAREALKERSKCLG